MKNRNNIRYRFLLIHRWLGLISGLVVFIVSITGCVYVFEEEWRDLFQHKYLYVTHTDREKKPITELLNIVRRAYPKEQVTSINFLEEKNSAFIFWTKSFKTISINPYNGKIIGHRHMRRDFMSMVLEMHVHLYMGSLGSHIVRWNVAIFFVMCISGLILWWPRQKRFFRQAVTIRWKTKNWKRLNWGLHSVPGFYALGVLLIISLTGIFWVFDSAKSVASFVTQSQQTRTPAVQSMMLLPAKANPLDSAYSQASFANPGARQVFISVPVDSVAPIRILLRYPYIIVRKETTIWFDQYSIANLHTDSYTRYSRYDYVSRSIYDFHTGRIAALGIGSKIVYFLAALFAASLPVTGLLIWYGRRNKRKSKLLSPENSHNHERMENI